MRTPAPAYDVVVVGLGAMGSAATYHLAKDGQSVLGLDARTPPHAFGSSHGESRIIREAYWEDPAYVPLVRRAFALWEELQAETKAAKAQAPPLLERTGALLTGVPDGDVVPGVRRARREHGVVVEDLDGDEVRRRFPQVRLLPGMEATFEPGAGVLRPEACVQAHLDGARRHGAKLGYDQPMLDLVSAGEGWRVRTPAGEHHAHRVILATGAWMERMSRIPLAIERQVQHWFTPRDATPFRLGRCPVWAVETEPGRLLYGFPDLGRGVKAALHHQGEAADPDGARRPPDAGELSHIEALVSRHVPGLAGRVARSEVCLYANTPDQDFAIGTDPMRAGVVLASPCSGHGFKFASAVGEALAHLATDRAPPVDIRRFDPARLWRPGVHHRPPKGPPTRAA